MTGAAEISTDGSRLKVRLPLAIRKRGGRKTVVAPQGALINPPRQRVDSTLVRQSLAHIAGSACWRRGRMLPCAI
jgi:hypothetical protein